MQFQNKKILVALLVILFSLSSEAQVAPDASFTDLEGNSHNIYSYLDDGYKVILVYGGYEGACWIGEWQTAVGSEIWDEFGPSGDNTVRMFFIDETDLMNSTDQSVANYTAQMGVEYPVVNLDNALPGYPVDGTPAFYAICLDKSYHSGGGFGEESSYEQMKAFLLDCDGEDLSNDIYFSGLKDKPRFCTKGDNHSFIPILHLMFSELNENNTDSAILTGNYLNQAYKIYYYLNGSIQDTFNMPPPTGEHGMHADQPTLPIVTLNSGDVIRYVLDYPNDSYSGNNEYEYTIPSNLEDSPISTTNLHKLVLGDNQGGGYFSIKAPLEDGGTLLHDFEQINQITLDDGNCYSVKFANNLFSVVALQDENSNGVVTVNELDFYPINQTPWLYFNVDSNAEPTTIREDNLENKSITAIKYYDINGKRISLGNGKQPFISYIQVIHFEDGSVTTKKFLRKY
ncbi:MAG: hypothetical protein ISP71_05460 [Flavobacteriales bacterium]|nr:hypothetical protein [Flavobacteriales bacterium]